MRPPIGTVLRGNCPDIQGKPYSIRTFGKTKRQDNALPRQLRQTFPRALSSEVVSEPRAMASESELYKSVGSDCAELR